MILIVTLAGLTIGVVTNRKSARQKLIQRLHEEKVQFETSLEKTNWFDRLPLVGAGEAIVSVNVWYDTRLNARTIRQLDSTGTVNGLSYVDQIGTSGVELLSRISTIEHIAVEYYVPAEHVAPFRNHKLRSYTVTGADVYPTPEAIRILYSIPTLRNLGTAHGDFDVPDELKKSRPEITIEITDFPA